MICDFCDNVNELKNAFDIRTHAGYNLHILPTPAEFVSTPNLRADPIKGENPMHAPAHSIQKLCEDIHLNRFGGSTEMVSAAVLAFADAARTSSAGSPENFFTEIESDVDAVLGVMPSIAPMINLLHRIMANAETAAGNGDSLPRAREGVAQVAEAYAHRQANALGAIGRIGGELIREGDRVATYSTSGTVWTIFKAAREQGKHFEVVVTESRPANEGLRTAREVSALGVPVTFGIDAVLGSLMRGCALLVAGADVITATGQVLVKVGTYLAALVAHEYGIPFYVAADTGKLDPLTLEGFPIKVGEKDLDLVTREDLPELVRVVNPNFELVPAHLVTGIITEQGVVHPGAVAGMMRAFDLSPRLVEKLRAWVQAPTTP